MNMLPNKYQFMGKQIKLSIYVNSVHPDFTLEFHYSHDFSNSAKKSGCLVNKKDFSTFNLPLSCIHPTHVTLPFDLTILTATIFLDVTNKTSDRAPARAEHNILCSTSRKDEICHSYSISSAQAQRWTPQSPTTRSLHK